MHCQTYDDCSFLWLLLPQYHTFCIVSYIPALTASKMVSKLSITSLHERYFGDFQSGLNMGVATF